MAPLPGPTPVRWRCTGSRRWRRWAAGSAFDDLLLDLSRKDDADFLRHVRARGLLLAADGTDYRVLILDDQTEQFNAEQRFERTFAANPAPALICRL